MPDSSRKKAAASSRRARGGATTRGVPHPGTGTQADDAGGRGAGRVAGLVRSLLAVLLVAAGIAWIVVYINVARDGQALTWMGELGRWNYLIGFGAIFLGLAVAAHRSTPLGRGRGVVVGMLGCFLIGLFWILVYYMAGNTQLPLITDLAQYNLVVGIGFMAVGFVYATHWE